MAIVVGARTHLGTRTGLLMPMLMQPCGSLCQQILRFGVAFQVGLHV